MPCKCKCGEWFDLNEGYATTDRYSNEVVCKSCHRTEVEIEEILDEIEELSAYGNQKREINKLRKRLAELGHEDSM